MNSIPSTGGITLGRLAMQLERDSSAYAVRIAGMIITGFGVLSLITLSGLGRNTTIAAALIPTGIVTFSIASRAASRIAIYRDTLTDRMLGAIADSDLIPEWAKEEVAVEYLVRGSVSIETLTKIDLRIVEQRRAERPVVNSTPGADRLVARYGKAIDSTGSSERSAP
ncbi:MULTISPECIES: hypothetical protein [unclassified Burkholderia]|uniref:hypothetical protein n=1 Tax=unclassified Burkholderia TaxID=2613784 RepID=UPI000754B198|nr:MULTISPECIES: hypothetical protein [unclassified Burkholderia]KUY85873.1 hypothetical protein WS46_05170 [Burkholderia sp. RF4-BP95]